MFNAQTQTEIQRLDQINATIRELEQERDAILTLPPTTHYTPRNIYIHYVPINSTSPSPCKLRANPFTTPLPQGTPYTIKGVWGCSPHRRAPMSNTMRVHISIDSWDDYVVAGKDLLP